MIHHKISAPEISKADKRIEALKITHAYAEYKMRHAGDLDAEFTDWANNIMYFLDDKKHEK